MKLYIAFDKWEYVEPLQFLIKAESGKDALEKIKSNPKTNDWVLNGTVYGYEKLVISEVIFEDGIGDLY